MSFHAPPEEPGRWGGLSNDPDKAGRQLAGLARNNRVLAARLAGNSPGEPGKTPGTPADLPGPTHEPGEMPAAPGDSPGKERAPGEIPGAPGQQPGKTELPGPAAAAPARRRETRAKVVQGVYRTQEPAPEPAIEATSTGDDAPQPLSRFERFYARLLGYPIGEEPREGADEQAPPLSSAERLYGRILGYDV
jgi:hypothetical protein